MTARASHLAVYWATQLGGWALYVSVFGVLSWIKDEYGPGQTELSLITMVVGLVCSHLLRAVMRRKGWQELPIPALIPRLTLAATLIGALAALLQAGLHDVLLPEAEAIFGGDGSRLFERMLGWVVVLMMWSLIYFAYLYFVRSRREELKSLRLETASRNDQLAHLRSQMNPHFMFNALNSIRALIDEDPLRAKRSITQLSAILRNAMSTVKRVTVPLGEELDMVKAYLDLEHMRFEERLRVSYDVDPALERTPVPPMMLQTLVENAVRHGVAAQPEGGEVHIAVQQGLHGLVISVTNSGRYTPGASRGTGIGLQNTRERLARIYGERAELRIMNRDGRVVTEVEMPVTTLAGDH
ncbi:MAG TPA: histidine kinase [Flavobacteriales bacterium]